MINSLSFIKRKIFFEPLVNYTTNEPLYEHIETSVKNMFYNKDYQIQKEKFLRNIRAVHASMVNPGDTDLRIFLYINIPLWIIVGMFFLSMFFGSDGFLENAGAASILILLAVIFMTIRPFYIAYQFISGFHELKQKEKTILNSDLFLQPTTYPYIWMPIIEISTKIGIDLKRIKVLYARENHCIPTVTDLKRIGTKLIIITIPRNLLILAKKNPQMYKSIIAHEMSHLTQGDSGIWMYYLLDFKCAYNLKDFFLNLIQGKEERLRKKYKAFNSSAEYLADLGSIILTEDLAIFDFLKSPYISDIESDFHPSTSTRIAFLKAFLYKHAKAVNLPVNAQWVSIPTIVTEEVPIITSKPVDMSEAYKKNLLVLSKGIRCEQKKLFGGGITTEIEYLLNNLANSKEECIQLLNNYQTLIKKDLVEDLIKINSSYELIRRNVSFFIERDIIEDSYPHDRKKPLANMQALS